MRKIAKNRVLMLFAVTLLITSLLLTNFNLVTGEQQPSNLIYLHGPSLAPIHMNSNITLTPIHMHSLAPWQEYIFRPKGTWWHELYPEFCIIRNLTSWLDNDYNEVLSPNDQIDMIDENETVTWYHVDRMTVTLRLTEVETGDREIYVELKIPMDWKPLPGVSPVNTYWHQVWPIYSNVTQCTDWWDDQDGVVDYCDYLEMTDVRTQNVTYWHIEEVSNDIILRWKMMNPICTWWHEIHPNYCTWHHLTSWEDFDYPYEQLSPGDQIDMNSDAWYWDTFWSMGDVNRDGYINPADMAIISLNFGLTVPPGDPRADLDRNGVINALDAAICTGNQGKNIWTYFPDLGKTEWYFVDRVTVTLNVTYLEHGEVPKWMKIELKTQYFEDMYEVFKHPVDTLWHEVYPNYCNDYYLEWWDPEDMELDNCNGVLDVCDHIWLYNMSSQQYVYCHVDDMTYDLILNEKITDPVCTDWLQLYPTEEEPSVWYHVDGWKDNLTNPYVDLLSPCDLVNLTLQPEGPTKTYHVESMSVTLKLSNLEGPYIIYVEADPQWVPFEYMYYPKIYPWGEFYWHEVWPVYSNLYYCSWWEDNCNGVLDYCDNITLYSVEGGYYTDWHVEEVAVDMVVSKVPGPMYWKPGFPDYAPSGMPDFDQRQGGTYNWTDPWGGWTHCGPVAVANSLWWLDSDFESGIIPPPTYSDNFPLVSTYDTMLPKWDDHDPSNVAPLVEHLAYMMDTNGLRTGKPGNPSPWDTNVFDMQTGITQYLSWTGVNPQGDCNGDGIVTLADAAIVAAAMGKQPGQAGWDMRADIDPVTTGWPNKNLANNKIDANDSALVAANMGKSGLFYEHTVPRPDFYYIEEEVERCQDVVLLLGFYYEYSPGNFYREMGHYVTVAGINSETLEIAISNPIRDDFHDGIIPTGRCPVPHPPYPHGSTVHNNASLVSHDIFKANWYPCPGGDWEILGYPGFDPADGWHVQIEYAVITSPYGVHDVAVTNVTTTTPGKTVVGQALTLKINVTVENQGTFTETFNVTCYAGNITVGKQQLTMNSGNTTTIMFIWNTTGVAKGNYTLSATADRVVGESDLVDNTFIDGIIQVVMKGDITADGKVNIYDLRELGKSYGSKIGEPKYKPNADLTCDGKINIYDLRELGKNYGKKDP